MMLKQPVLNAFGGTVKLAEALSIKHQAISKWNTIIPAKRAEQISQTLPRHHLSVLGADTIDNGYAIVPLAARSKQPKVPNWTELKMTKADVLRYSAMEYNGVGILAKLTPAIDIDILDEKIAQHMIAFVRGQFEAVAPLQRTGKAPKTLFVFRCAEPFKKKKSKAYRDLEGNKHQVEILADGEQFVAFNIHPDTQQNYTWHDNRSPFNVPMRNLPILTEAFAEAVIKEFERAVPKEWVCGSSISPTTAVMNSEARATGLTSIVSFISEDDVARHLSLLNAENYDIWCRVGMALHHQFKGSSKGFALWDTWSAGASNYNAGAMQAKWDSFKKDNSDKPLTYLTVISLYDAEVQKAHEIEKKQFYQRYIYVKNPEGVIDQYIQDEQNCMMTRNAFKNAKLHLTREFVDEEGNVQNISVANEWLKSSRKQVVDNIGYKPLDKRIYKEEGAVLYNTFRFPKHRECNADLSLFYEHIHYLFPVESEAQWFIDWMAFNIQYPERKSLVSPLHVSPYQGTGRGWLVHLLCKLLGHWNTSKTNAETLSGAGSRFNDYRVPRGS